MYLHSNKKGVAPHCLFYFVSHLLYINNLYSAFIKALFTKLFCVFSKFKLSTTCFIFGDFSFLANIIFIQLCSFKDQFIKNECFCKFIYCHYGICWSRFFTGKNYVYTYNIIGTIININWNNWYKPFQK